MNEKNIPVELLDALSYTDEETLQKSVEIIEKFIEEKAQGATPKFVGIEPCLLYTSCAVAINKMFFAFNFCSRVTCSSRFLAIRSYLWIRIISNLSFSQSRNSFWYCVLLAVLPLTASSMYVSMI